MSDAEVVRRPMRYPYTYAAKIAQFPYKFHFQNSWMYRYYLYGMILTVPVFYKINKLVNSPENIRAAEEKKRKEEEAHHH